jgi:serine/threonine-protein kinase RsbW
MIPTFEFTHATDANACVAHLSGDIDTAVVPELRRSLEARIQSGCHNFILDMSDVTYADSSALGLLVWMDHRLRPEEGRVMLAGANPDVSRILELSGLASLATSVVLSSDVQTALESLEMGEVAGSALWRHKITIPAEVDRLAGVRDEVSSLVTPLGFTESAVFDIKVALGEALANAVRHGSPNASGEVSIEAIAFPDRVVLEVSDSGVGFNGEHSMSPDLYAPSGRGIMFMRALMDRVEFEPAPGGGTLVRLVKHHGGTG